MTATVKDHPVAVTTAGGSSLAVLCVWLAGRFGVSLSAEEGTLIAGATATLVALVGREGLCGLAQRLLHGSPR